MPTPGVELSLVLPCLDEAETLEACVRKAQNPLRRLAVAGEPVVADNVSPGGSQDIARVRLSLTRIGEG